MATTLSLKYADLKFTPAYLHQLRELNFKEIEDYINQLTLRVEALENLDLSSIVQQVYNQIISTLFLKFTLKTTLLNGQSESIANPNDPSNPWTLTRTLNKYRISVINKARIVQLFNVATMKQELCTIRIGDTYVELEFDQQLENDINVHITTA